MLYQQYEEHNIFAVCCKTSFSLVIAFKLTEIVLFNFTYPNGSTNFKSDENVARLSEIKQFTNLSFKTSFIKYYCSLTKRMVFKIKIDRFRYAELVYY